MANFLGRIFGKLSDRKRRLQELPPDVQNLEHNKALWNRYAETWRKDEIPIQNRDIGDAERDRYIKYLGDEWGRVSDAEAIVAEYIHPFISPQAVVAEIGVGGGRIAAKVVDRVKELWCFDISENMLSEARRVLVGHPNLYFVLLEEPKFPEDKTDAFDFVYSFDVFVHLDLHMMWKYFQEIRRVLKSGGHAFLHTSNLRAPGGWKSFVSQSEYSVVRHYFISPEIIKILAGHAELSVVKVSDVDTNNFYLNRDFLFVLQKP